MDQSSVPVDPACPPAQSSAPATRHDSTPWRSATPAITPERRPRTPERFPRTPQRSTRTSDRRVRTPIRRARSCSESRDSRSSSPVSRSSSVEFPTRDWSPVNFTAAMDPDIKRVFSDDEDDDGDSKKISTARYQIFRQAVTASKGSFKVNPAKTKQASRAFLQDLGDPEVTDRVSWLDQPSLQDTLVFSTARIAQGLKDDEEVEKTTLSETLNTQSPLHSSSSRRSSFPQGTLPSQDSLWCPLRAQASWWPRSQWQQGPSSYQMSHRTCLDTEELARRSAIYASLADYGGIGDWKALAQGRTL